MLNRRTKGYGMLTEQLPKCYIALLTFAISNSNIDDSKNKEVKLCHP